MPNTTHAPKEVDTPTPPSPNDTYTSPLAARNASAQMLRLWSPKHKFNTWRRIWLAVAEAQHEVTKDQHTPLVTMEQVEELRAVVERGITDEELARASELERELRHDVMSHVHCLGEQCPLAKPIIHLGMTSQDVVCNADLDIMRSATSMIAVKLARLIDAMGGTALKYVNIPALGFTHYQSAQPVTVGRRCAHWACDLAYTYSTMAFSLGLDERWRGLRGATGTQASFLQLFDFDGDKAERLEQLFLASFVYDEDVAEYNAHYEKDTLFGADDPDEKMGSTPTFAITGQTYPRVHDTIVLSNLASIASVLHKTATDIRLLSNRKEIDEPFETNQIGSSAMPYKRNPMRCERICGLTRFVMNLVGNAYDTAATQWLERTLDDSSNRRLSLPEAFLALDGALDLMHNVATGFIVNEAMVKKNLMLELPFMATENILMEAVKAGGDRQDLHERIRVHSLASGNRVKQEGLDNDLLDRIKADPAFAPPALTRELDWSDLMDPMKYVGRSVEQTERFIEDVVEPMREQYANAFAELGQTGPRV